MSARIITVPNLLTVFRMVLIPVFVSLLFYQKFVLALSIFVLAGVTDGLDGLLARRF
jgi:cardiolipin synthase